jgi:hypothetical protein
MVSALSQPTWGKRAMQIDEGSTVAVVVKRTWANLHGVRMFLHENPLAEIRGVDESHVLFVKVLDAEDSKGVWIEVDRRKPTQDSGVEQFHILVPWSEVLALVVGKEFSSAIRQEARRIGFTGEMEPE